MISNLRPLLIIVGLASLITCLAPLKAGSESNYFYITSSSVRFRSVAALEIITAVSQKMQGIVDISKKTFAFSLLSSSFNGFNSTLQREHFNENYLETEKFPVTLFKGKIIEDVDFNKPGIYEVRAKGTLQLHGVSHERIIRSKIIVKEGWLEIESHFMLLLNDHDIKVPKVVHEKIAEEIVVELKMKLERK